MAPNPFKYAGPLGEGDLFVDRQEEMEKILELISRAQPVAIYGERRIGKTSLLNRIRAQLSGQRVAYISLEALRDEDEFLKWLAGVLGCKDWSTPIDLVPALEAQKPILLLDEFDKAALSDQFTSDFFHLLRAWASQGLIRLVIASARKPSELFSQSENITSPFYNIFYVIPILPLDADALAALRLQLKKLLAEDEALAQELVRLLEQTRPAGQTVIASGDRSVAIGGSVSGSMIVTGDRNKINKG